MKIQDSVAFVTGSNRGLGLAFVHALKERGARKIYAASREPSVASLTGVIPVRLDVTDPQQIAAAVEAAGDVSLLVNNAGIALGKSVLAAGAVEAARAELETNLFGPLQTSRAFAPVLARNGGGAIINVLSVLSWLSLPQVATYGVSKSAAWSLTNALRAELRVQGTQVVAVHVGFMDTDMARGVAGTKARPEDVAAQSLAALETGELEVLADAIAHQVKRGLSSAVYLTAQGPS